MKTSISAILTAIASIALAVPVTSPEPATSTPEEAAHPLVRRDTCNTGYLCTVADANDAMNYFINKGTENCNTLGGGQYSSIWQSGNNCAVWAHAIGKDQATSYCRDVGYGIRNIINNCQSNGLAGGNGAAGGNGNFGLTLFGSK